MSLHMYKDMVDLCSVNDLPATAGVKSVEHWLLAKENEFHFMDDGQPHNLLILDQSMVPIFDGEEWRAVVNKERMTFDALSVSDGTFSSFTVGYNYYVYLCVDGGTPSLVTSLNSTFPQGSTANTSRRIGEFHYGNLRKVSDEGSYCPVNPAEVMWGALWQTNVFQGIVPNCIKDLVNYPLADYGVMCQIGPHGRGYWVTKYQLSSDNITLGPTAPTAAAAAGAFNTTNYNVDNTSEAATLLSGGESGPGTLISQYGKIPLTGQEGMCAYNFDTLAARTGGRLLTWTEWIAVAYGSPRGQNNNNYAWTASANTNRCRTGAGVDPSTGEYSAQVGVKPMAVSAWNLDDCVGNVWEWGAGYWSPGNPGRILFGGAWASSSDATSRQVTVEAVTIANLGVGTRAGRREGCGSIL